MSKKVNGRQPGAQKKIYITSDLPDGKNFFCRFAQKAGLQFVEWDTDINFAKVYLSNYAAKQDLKRINEVTAKIESI